MHRLFVALRPPAALRARLIAAMGGIPGARWQRDDQLHLTLRFIGEVDRHAGEDIAAALGAIHFPRFALALDGIGQFDRKGRIDSLWAGVTPHDEVARLHAKVDAGARPRRHRARAARLPAAHHDRPLRPRRRARGGARRHDRLRSRSR